MLNLQAPLECDLGPITNVKEYAFCFEGDVSGQSVQFSFDGCPLYITEAGETKHDIYNRKQYYARNAIATPQTENPNFSQTEYIASGRRSGKTTAHNNGPLRDAFAMAALTGLIAYRGDTVGRPCEERAYEIADAMMEARKAK